MKNVAFNIHLTLFNKKTSKTVNRNLHLQKFLHDKHVSLILSQITYLRHGKFKFIAIFNKENLFTRLLTRKTYEFSLRNIALKSILRKNHVSQLFSNFFTSGGSPLT